MKIKTLFSFIFLFILQLGIAIENLEQFNKATTAFDSSNYVEAVKIYESLIAKDIISSDLHFNLGNAFFKQNDIPKAILNYEKAIKIDPNNTDAAYNLKLANSKTIDKIESIPDLFLYRWWKTIFNLFSSENWAKLTVLVLFFSIGFAALYFFSNATTLKKTGFYGATTLFFIMLFTWFLAQQQRSYLNQKEYAIIIEPTVNINSSPSMGSSKLFVLHEGTKVKIENETNEWFEISLPNGNKGWVKSALLKGI